MTGPGSLAMENHDDLAGRLAALVAQHGIAYQRRAITGSTPYGDPFKVDLLLPGLPAYPKGLAIVARWQEASGSADQKLLFLLACIRRTVIPTYIVLDGEGWRESVWEYLANPIQLRGQFLGALTVEDFAKIVLALKEAA